MECISKGGLTSSPCICCASRSCLLCTAALRNRAILCETVMLLKRPHEAHAAMHLSCGKHPSMGQEVPDLCLPMNARSCLQERKALGDACDSSSLELT